MRALPSQLAQNFEAARVLCAAPDMFRGVTRALPCVRGLYGEAMLALQGAVACGATCAELRAKDEARQPRRRAHNVCWVAMVKGVAPVVTGARHCA